ncbi:MAG: hypothetical protein A3I14_18440 [Candidatus Rokubacteria bacterium RIFCSPLOWO2_02_FULL_73_56]|nr:MAG: hypothetical protein A3D33_10925 [Candidatus Rokubacteria bacterium RIFCSPHIGHO2_02_FULL_73_26]OGL13220.1 MAG: hypothetical protein A3I14_18440 [Candidatus Rokubacteria bacterium RIFCSPLOWO2_02_FULL_73_56]OGL28626.1 MAG: hypothetical protein A3G44_16835 [Candidatus Rokubacteria bacterium RIFCSPLOWO2_12_FULL_73_47]
MRYTVESAAGRHDFRLTEDLRRTSLAYFRLSNVYRAIRPEHPRHVASAARYLCAKHAGLGPLSVTFHVRRQLRITPEAWVAGHRPLDEASIETQTLPPLPCAAPARGRP